MYQPPKPNKMWFLPLVIVVVSASLTLTGDSVELSGWFFDGLTCFIERGLGFWHLGWSPLWLDEDDLLGRLPITGCSTGCSSVIGSFAGRDLFGFFGSLDSFGRFRFIPEILFLIFSVRPCIRCKRAKLTEIQSCWTVVEISSSWTSPKIRFLIILPSWSIGIKPYGYCS